MNDFETLYVDDVAVIVLNITNCTIYHQKKYKKIIDEEINSGRRKFIIDFSKCESIDSFFEAAINGTILKISENDGKLKIVEPENISQNIFGYTRQFFESYKSSADALGSYENTNQ